MSMAYKIGITSGFAVFVAVLCFFIFSEPGSTEAGDENVNGNGKVAMVPDGSNGVNRTNGGSSVGNVRQNGVLGATNATSEDNSALSRILNEKSVGNGSLTTSDGFNTGGGSTIGSTGNANTNAGVGANNSGVGTTGTGDLNDRAALARARVEADANGSNDRTGTGGANSALNNRIVNGGNANNVNPTNNGGNVTGNVGASNVGGAIGSTNSGVANTGGTDSTNNNVTGGANTGARVNGNASTGTGVVRNEGTAEVVKPMTHTIRDGETLIQIARVFYGDGERWRDIAKANPKVNPDKLRVGMTLKLPDKAYVQPSRADELRSLRNVVSNEGKAVRVTAKKGDTLSDISLRVYGTARLWKQIYEANKQVLKSPNVVPVGAELVIPPKG